MPSTLAAVVVVGAGALTETETEPPPLGALFSLPFAWEEEEEVVEEEDGLPATTAATSGFDDGREDLWEGRAGWEGGGEGIYETTMTLRAKKLNYDTTVQSIRYNGENRGECDTIYLLTFFKTLGNPYRQATTDPQRPTATSTRLER